MSEPSTRRGRTSGESEGERRGTHSRRDAEVGHGVSTGLLVALVVAVILLAALVGFIVVMANRPATVPDVLMKTEADATQALSNVRLRVGEISHVATSAVGPGLVVAQTPGAGAAAIAGSQVDLTFAEQPRSANVPRVVGMKEAAAQAQLTSDQFVPLTYSQYSATVPAGEVVAQLPAAGTPYLTGQQTVISVSLGKAPTTAATVPQLTGTDEQVARQALGRGKLVGYWLYNQVSAQPPGKVLGQLPDAGVKVPPGTQVAVWVAGEPPQ